MTMRRWWGLALIAGGGALALWWWTKDNAIEPSDFEPITGVSLQPGPSPEVAPSRFVVVGDDPLTGRVGAGLNGAGGSGKRDLQILQEVLAAWRTNAPELGNPVGNNFEITAALTGANPWGVAIIPPNHPAINAEGELCDRWGTPLFFHQLSGDRMEIWSNGPDRRRGTDDDVIVVP
jgi:hypothetical protein